MIVHVVLRMVLVYDDEAYDVSDTLQFDSVWSDFSDAQKRKESVIKEDIEKYKDYGYVYDWKDYDGMVRVITAYTTIKSVELVKCMD